MLGRLQTLWETRGLDIVFGVSVVFIIVLALHNKIIGRKGTWTNFRSAIPPLSKRRRVPLTRYSSRYHPPRESKGEAECRRVLQHHFNRPFNSVRPDFLRNPVTGGSFNLELDCYNPELKLAVEYNGVQHYKYVPYFHKNYEAFLNQKYRDELKYRMCKEAGITVIPVPSTVKIPDIRNYLIKELRRHGYT